MKGMFYVADWQTKARFYIEALEAAGWRQTRTITKAAFLLSDVDVMSRLPLVEQAYRAGKKIFLYPHAARAMVQWDGMCEPFPHITASITIAEGQTEVMRRY